MDLTVMRPLGDQAVFAYLSDEAEALAFAAAVRNASEPWVIDIVQAYASVAVFYELDQIEYESAAKRLEEISREGPTHSVGQVRHLRIPCCYEKGLDLDRVAQHTGLTGDLVVQMHAGSIYTVYAIGFCPGFPYLGYLPRELSGVPRLPSPRLRIEAGSVGLTGRQTGIYTEARPGGWNIVGQTPLELVNIADGYFPLRTGDQVQFYRIDDVEFRRLAGERL